MRQCMTVIDASKLRSPVNFWNNVSGTLGGGFAVDTNGNVAIAIPTSQDVYTPSTLAIYNSSDTQILEETWQAADGTMLPVISNPGHSGVLPILRGLAAISGASGRRIPRRRH